MERPHGFASTIFPAVVVLLLAALPLQSAFADEWQWIVAPYVWVPGVTVDSDFSGQPGIPDGGGDSSIIDKLEAGFMGHVEGRKGRWGAYVEFIYVELGDTQSMTLGPGGPISGDLVVSSDLKLGLLDIGGLYRLTRDESGSFDFDVLLGARIIDIDLDTLITVPLPGTEPVDVGTSISDADVMLGGRFLGRINERWYWTARADVSFGDSEGTVNALASVGYNFGETGLFSLDLGYRHLTLKTTSRRAIGPQMVHDLKVSGPVVGFVFRF